ncbi:MAG: NADH-quinone oxidoreductase subunit NuoG [Chloroflexi bacterium]|nr:NADH-quinone oxidoreductase subunit NuoG [Chloroflexota bacterium]
MSDLVKLTIDGVEVEVPKGTLIVDAAKQIGNDIPVFCYHPKLEPVGMCRMCLVEVGFPMRDRATGELTLDEDGRPKLNFGYGLQTACTMPVGEGIEVRTATETVKEAQASVLEFLLSSHPLDCPICDKGGECPLQNLTMAHGHGDTRMHFSDKMKLEKSVPLGELIYLDQERCIQCARCIRFQEEIADDPVIRFHDRGRHTEIVTLSDPGFNSYWSGNTADICPVGALTSVDFRFGARPWEMKSSASLCTHCPVGCNTAISTRREAKSGGRHVIKRIMPRQNEAVNELWMCDKGRFVHHFAESADRLTAPLIRKNGELVEASWSEALDFAAGKLQQNGTAVAGLAGDRLSNEDLFQFQKLFRKGLKSGNIDLAARRLAGGDVVAQVGLSSGSNLKELGKGDAIIVVAADLHEEAPVWQLRVKQAAERGAALIVLNARATRLDKYASHVIHYQPGQAVNAVKRLVNLAKVETEANGDVLGAAAETVAKVNNLVAFYGSEGATYADTDAIAKLLANLLLMKNGNGRAGQPNNGLIPVWPHGNTQGAWDMGVHPALGPGYAAVVNPGMDAAAIYESATNGDVKALFVMGADPVGDGLMADKGKLEFLVVQELFMTETAVLADVVLPAQSWAEREGTFTSGERRVQRYYPAIAAVGGAKADWQILAELGERTGLGKPAFAASLVFNEIAKAASQYKGMDYRTLAQVEKQWPDVGGEDAYYYAGSAQENRAGLGQQWPAAAESGDVAAFEAAEPVAYANDGIALIRTAALYTPGTLINESAILADRLAQPTISVNAELAAESELNAGDLIEVNVGGTAVTALVHVNNTPPGLMLLSGVPYVGGTAVAKLGQEIND